MCNVILNDLHLVYIRIRGDKQIKNPTNFKKEAYRDGIKRKGHKIGMVNMYHMSSNVKVVAT